MRMELKMFKINIKYINYENKQYKYEKDMEIIITLNPLLCVHDQYD